MKENVSIIEYKAIMKMTLSKKRFQHSLNVADECEKLADFYGVSSYDCYLGGLLHDIRKDDSPESLKEQVLASNIECEPVELETPALWHAIASAAFARNVLKITDEDIISAIRFHTVARAKMSLIEKIVYVADLISSDRTYKDVAKMRKLAYTNINDATFFALRFQVGNLVNKINKIPIKTLEAYNYYLDNCKKENIK